MPTLAARLAASLVIAVAAHGGDNDPLVRRAHGAIGTALNTALETIRGENTLPWSDPQTGLEGAITVYEAAPHGGRLCRSFRYVVHDAAEEVTDTGLFCREPIGLWTSRDTAPEITVTRALVAPAPPPVARLPGAGPAPDPALARLQRNLERLAYLAGPADGLPSPAFDAALKEFRADDGIAATDPDALGRALARSGAEVARLDQPQSCDALPGQPSPLVCGRRR